MAKNQTEKEIDNPKPPRLETEPTELSDIYARDKDRLPEIANIKMADLVGKRVTFYGYIEAKSDYHPTNYYIADIVVDDRKKQVAISSRRIKARLDKVKDILPIIATVVKAGRSYDLE